MLNDMLDEMIAYLPLWFQPYADGLYNAVYLIFSVGIVSALALEIFRRIERLFVKEGSPNWRIVHRDRPFFKREFLSELGWPLINGIVLIPLMGVKQYLLVEAILRPNFPTQPLAPALESIPMWAQVIVGLFVLDLTLYIRHRFVHHFFWPYHTIHHAAREVTWLTMLRLHPLDSFVMSLVLSVVLYFIGFSGEGIALAGIIHFHWNRFVHSNLALDYGFPLRYIFVSPNMHRWHHAADDPNAFNKNFAITFAFIDLMFGTFYVPKDRLPTTYGVMDEHGEHVVSERFLPQLLHPFVMHKRWLVKMWGRITKKPGQTPPPNTKEPLR